MNPIIALIIANIIWGAAAPLFKFSLTNIPPFTLAFIRFFFAGLLFLPFLVGFNYRTITRTQWIELLLGTFFGITINISFFFLGLQKAESINAPIIASSGPLFLFLLAVIFLRESARPKVFAGMLISLFGVLVIVFSPFLTNGNVKQDEAAFVGNIFYIVATLGGVISVLLLKNVLQKINVYVVTGIIFLFGSLTFIPFMIKELETWRFTDLNTAGWTGILFGVVFSSAIAYYLHNYGLSKIRAQEVGVFTYIDPVIAVLIAIPLLHEYPNVYFFVGSLLVFGGIYISEGRFPYHPFHRIREK